MLMTTPECPCGAIMRAGCQAAGTRNRGVRAERALRTHPGVAYKPRHADLPAARFASLGCQAHRRVCAEEPAVRRDPLPDRLPAEGRVDLREQADDDAQGEEGAER